MRLEFDNYFCPGNVVTILDFQVDKINHFRHITRNVMGVLSLSPFQFNSLPFLECHIVQLFIWYEFLLQMMSTHF